MPTQTRSPSAGEGFTDCYGCGFTAELWQFTLSGITNGTCSDCSNLNDTFTLTRNFAYSYCRWFGESEICGLGLSISLSRHFSGTQLTFVSEGLPVATYNLSGSFNCNGPNTFDKVSASGKCSNWPATIEITPASSSGWVNPNNLTSSNDQRATFALVTVTGPLRPKGFNFNIPLDSTILGVSVEVEHQADYDYDYTFNLSKDGTNPVGTGKTGTLSSTTDILTTLGNSSDLWGTTLTPVEVNSAFFGLKIIYTNVSSPSGDVEVDHVTITVHYTGGSSTLKWMLIDEN